MIPFPDVILDALLIEAQSRKLSVLINSYLLNFSLVYRSTATSLSSPLRNFVSSGESGINILGAWLDPHFFCLSKYLQDND